jgi:hypothetical protein
LIGQERGQTRADSGRIHHQGRELPKIAHQVDELIMQRGVLRPGAGNAIDDPIERELAATGLDLDDGQRRAVPPARVVERLRPDPSSSSSATSRRPAYRFPGSAPRRRG